MIDTALYGLLLEAVRLLFLIVLPVVAAVTIVGLLVGTFQAATTIQDAALGYAGRVVAVLIVLYLMFPLFSRSMLSLAEQAFR